MSGLGDIWQSLDGQPKQKSTALDDFFTVSPDASDVEKGAAAARVFEQSFGLKSADGALLSGGNPLSGGEYYRRVKKIFDTEGESLESDALRAWKKIPAANREQRLKIARENRGLFKNLASVMVGSSSLVPPSIGNPDMRRPGVYEKSQREEDDRIIAEYEAGLDSENWLLMYRSIQPDLSDTGRDIVKAGIESGEIPARLKNDFMALEPDEAEKVSFLVRSSRPASDRNLVRDMAYSTGGMIKRMGKNIASVAAAGMRRARAPMNPMSFGSYSLSEHARRSAPIDQRSIDDERISRALLRDANAHKPYEGYSQAEEALIGAASTLPYMAVAAVPYAGLAAVAIDQFQSVSDRVLMQGGNPHEALAAQWAAALAYAYVEKLSALTAFEKPLTTLGRRALFLNISKYGYRYAFRQLGGEIALVTGAETFEEMLQQAIEEGTVAAELGGDIGKEAIRGFIEQADTWKTMLIVSGGGAAVKGYRAKNFRADAESVIDYVKRRRRVHEMMQDKEPDYAAQQDLLNRARGAFDTARSNNAAASALQDLGFDREQAAGLIDMFSFDAAAESADSRLRSWMRSDGLDAQRMINDLVPEAATENLPGGGLKVTMSVGSGGKGSRKSYIISFSGRPADIESAEFAVSVSEATGGRVSPAAFMAKSVEQKRKYLADNGIVERGKFDRITSPDGKNATADGLISMVMTPPDGGEGASNLDLFHETFHAVVSFARDAGVLGEGEINTLVNMFGTAQSDGELFNEEAGAIAYSFWLAGRDSKDVGRKNLESAAGIWAKLRNIAERIMRTLGLMPPDESVAEKRRNRVFEAVRSGDFSGFPADAGVQVTDDVGTVEVGDGSAEQQGTLGNNDAQKAVAVGDAAQTAGAEQKKVEKREEQPSGSETSDEQRQRLRPRDAVTQIVTPSGGVKFQAVWRAVELDDLVTSDRSDYPDDLQPRDRGTVTSRVQIYELAKKGVFDPERLFDSVESDGGSPIIAGGLNVLSGNGRTLALRELDKQGRWREYADAAEKKAAELGVDIEGMNRPVLVRRVCLRPSSASLADIAELSNRSKILNRSAAETARADSKVILEGDLLGLFNPGTNVNLLAKSNNRFMQSFAKLAGAEGLLDSRGRPTEELALRVKRALLTGIIEDENLQRLLVEQSGELGIKGINRALIKESGHVLRLERNKPHLGIAGPLGRAVSSYIRMKSEGWDSLSEYRAQGDLLAGQVSEVDDALLQAVDSGELSEFLSRYVEIASKLDADGSADMFGESTAAKDVAAKVAGELGLSAGSRYSVAARKPWAADFPKAVLHSSKVQSRFSELFAAAKAGDTAAAVDLVGKCIKPGRIRELASNHPDAVVVAVHAEEASGRNAIPSVMAAAFSVIGGFKLDKHIVQINRAQHTGADAISRLARAPEFDGDVESGREYILVDDHITSGSTIAELRHYIENNGGRVVAVSALTASMGSSTIAPSEKALTALYKRYGGYEKTKQILKESGVAADPAALSNSQVRYITKLLPDSFRDRVAQARQGKDTGSGTGTLAGKTRYSVAVSPDLYDLHEQFQQENYRLRVRVRKSPQGEATDMRSLTNIPRNISGILGVNISGANNERRVDEFAPVRVIGRLSGDAYQTIVNHAVANGYHYMEYGIEDRDGNPVSTPFKSPELKRQDETDLDYADDNAFRVVLFGQKKAGEKLKPVMIKKYLSNKQIPLSEAREAALDFDNYSSLLSEAGRRGYKHVALGIMNSRGFWQEQPQEFKRNEFGNWNSMYNFTGASEIDISQQEEFADAEDLQKAGVPGVKYEIATVDLATGEDLIVRDDLYDWNVRDVYYKSVYGDMTTLARWPQSKHYAHGIRDAKTKEWAFFPPVIDSPISRDDASSFPLPAHRQYSGRYSVGFARNNPQGYVEALYATEMMAGKKVSVSDVEQTLHNVGLPAELAPVLITAAKSRADGASADFVEQARNADRAFIERLADDVEKEHYLNRLVSGFEAGASAAERGVTAAQRLEKATMHSAQRALESAAGYTAAEMQAELALDLSRIVLEMPEHELSPEEQALREKLRVNREALAAEVAAAAQAGLDSDTVEVPDAVKGVVDELLRIAKINSQAARTEREMAAAERLRNLDEQDSAADGAAQPADNENEASDTPAGIMHLLAPVMSDSAEFAAFVLEWSTRKISTARGEPDRAKLYRNPAAVRDLIKTSQHILGKLAQDLIGNSTGRINAEKDIARMIELKTVRAVVKDLTYIYGRIHQNALRKSRTEMVAGLVKQIKSLAVDGPRWQARKVNLDRKVSAAVEMYARNILSVVNLTPAAMEAAKQRLEKIIENAHKEEQGTYRVKDDRKYTEAFDRLAVLKEYGGMVYWMPGRIEDAASRIEQDLLHHRAEFEQQRLEYKERTGRVRKALIGAVRRGNDKTQLEPGRWSKTVDSFIGNLQLRLNHMIRYARGKKRVDGLAAVEEIMFRLGRSAEKLRNFEIDGHADMHGALQEIYGDAKKALKHLDSKIPAEISSEISNQGIALTFGQALQLYGSMIQGDYRDNVKHHGRQFDVEKLRSVLTVQDLALHAWMVQWYANNRLRLSEVQEQITGLAVLSPDAMYTPVKMQMESGGMRDKHQSWTPLMRSLTPRIRNQRDFDETADIITMFASRLNDAALTVAYGETGLWISEVVGSSAFQTEAERFHGKYFVNELMDHFGSVLRGGKPVVQKNQYVDELNSLRGWTARIMLSGNMLSAIKQLASMPVWANVVGVRDLMRYSTDINWDAVGELMESAGYKARYRGGWSVETTTVMQLQNESAISKFYDRGLILNSIFDSIPGLWIAQGFYRDLKSNFIDKGYSEKDATERAQTITWNMLEQTQQSGRVENQLSWVRSGGIAKLLTQFTNSPIQQLQFELEAAREVAAGTPGAKKRLLKAVVINHVVLPALFALIAAGWAALLGRDDEPDEQFKDWMVASLLGQANRIFLAGAMAESGIKALVMGDNSDFGNDSALPVSSLVSVIFQTGKAVRTAGAVALDAITPWDLTDLTYEDINEELDRLGKKLVPPYRHMRQAYENRQ